MNILSNRALEIFRFVYVVWRDSERKPSKIWAFVSPLMIRALCSGICRNVKITCNKLSSLVQYVYIYIYIYIYMEETAFQTQFLPGRVDTAVWMHSWDANKTAGEEARRQLHRNVVSNVEQVLAATPHKAPTIRPPASHHENYPDMQGRAHKWCTPMDPYIWPSKSRMTSSNIHTAAIWGYGM